MPINKETHTILQVIIPKEEKAKLEEIAKKNNRSASAQALTYIQEGMKNGDKYDYDELEKKLLGR